MRNGVTHGQKHKSAEINVQCVPVCVCIKCDNAHFSAFSLHRAEKWSCDISLTNPFKALFILTFRMCVSIWLENLFPPPSLFSYVYHATTDCLSSLPVPPPHRNVQSLADKSKQEALRNDLMDAIRRKQQS